MGCKFSFQHLDLTTESSNHFYADTINSMTAKIRTLTSKYVPLIQTAYDIKITAGQ